MRRNSLNIFTHALLLAALLLIGATPSMAQVSVSLPAVTAVAGESGTIDLTVGDLTGENVIAYEMTVEFDPDVVQLTGVSTAGTLSEGLEVSPNATNNSITVAAAGVMPISGSGTLLSFTADFVAAGVSPLTVTDFQFNEGDPASDVEDGSVTIPTVAVVVGDATVADSVVTVPINTTSDLTGEDIISYQFTVEFDPNVVALTGADAAGTLSDGMSVDFNSTEGSLTVAAAGALPLEGEGTLINLTGTALAEGSTTLTFTDFQFNEGTPTGGGMPGTITISFDGGGQVGTPENPLEIPVATTAPVIDGEFDDVWTDAATMITIDNVVAGEAPISANDLAASAWVMYDRTNLYVLYQVDDDSLVNNSPESWQDDAVDLYIDGGNEHSDSTRDANDAQFEFSWGDETNTVTGDHQGNNEGVEYAWVTRLAENGDTLGYYIEAVVPWHNFGVAPAGNMETIGIEFMVNDDDPPGMERDTKMAWYANEDNAWQWSHVLGYAVLVGTPPVGTETSPLDIPTTPGPPKIDGVIDLAWAEHANSIMIGNTVSDPGTEPDDESDLSAQVWFMYDQGNLYVLYDVNDSDLINDSNDSWQDDAVDLYIDAGNEHTENARDANDAQYEFSWGDDSLAVTGDAQGNNEDVRYAYSTKVTEEGDTTGYIIEAQVPWKNFSDVLTPSGNNEIIGIEFMVNDDDAPGGDTRDTKMAWFANEDNAWQYSHVLGYGRLIGDPVGSGDPWAPFIIPQTEAAPELDGEREAAWDTANRLELNKWSGDNQPENLADLNPSAELMFDADYLYVFYQTPDDALFNDSEATWQDDSFDLDIDAGNEKCFECYDDNDAAFEFGYDATMVTGNAAENGFIDGVEFVSVETADGYAIEARVPWANFNLTPYDGTLIGLEIKANDDDTGGDARDTKYGWYEDMDNAWQYAHVFGTAQLSGTIIDDDVEVEPGVPERFAIESVYPNPFNPSTTAMVAVREVGDYDVQIYNVLGQLIEKQRITATIPGRMEVNLDFGRYASGLYLISVKNLQTGKIATAKAILAK